MLYYIYQTPLSSWRIEGGSGDETIAAVTWIFPFSGEGVYVSIDSWTTAAQIASILIQKR